MQDEEIFKLNPTRQYEKCRKKLDDHLITDLDNKLVELVKKPDSTLATPLKGNLSGRYAIRFGKNTHRLIIRIKWNSKSIILLYLAARAVVYNGKMW